MGNPSSLCIHAHFYQPSREDPFSGRIPDEKGAAPYQNWNEKILETCYRPNAELGNFGKLSFNLGPTLSKWLSSTAPEVLAEMVKADGENVKKLGVGNAIAQPYNHTILPLSTSAEKETQIVWGIRDFKHHFGRDPEGMWLPETAVDLETLDLLASHGIAFTILAPWQVKSAGAANQTAFRINLEEDRSIVVFTYHGGLSSRVSFDPAATQNADHFVESYLNKEIEGQHPGEMTMIATDGELYGHHQPFRDKFLSHLLNGSLSRMNLNHTFPGLWLKQGRDLPVGEIREYTSWSCHHGVERWQAECACTPGGSWKEPLRKGLNLLANEVDQAFKDLISKTGNDPDLLRNDYIDVILGAIPFKNWIQNFTGQDLDPREEEKYAVFFQAQFERQRMFTSCGWFFEDLDRIEPRNNLSFAAHAAWLMNKASGWKYSDEVVEILKRSRSHVTGLNAGEVFVNALNQFADKRSI